MDCWIVGNWKMNGSLEHCQRYVPALLEGLRPEWGRNGLKVGLCPAYPYLAAMTALLAGSAVRLGAQAVHPLDAGAFTAQVSPAMLREFGVTLCLVGHSERRQYAGDSNQFVGQNLHALLAMGIVPVLCVGETLRERETGQEQAVVRQQLEEAFRKAGEGERTGRRRGDVTHRAHPILSDEQARHLIVAYEPVWAIGTGRTAAPEQADAMHACIRTVLRERFGPEVAATIPILYGGSVTADNAGTLMAQPEINGLLVGGASLKPETFVAIISQSCN